MTSISTGSVTRLRKSAARNCSRTPPQALATTDLDRRKRYLICATAIASLSGNSIASAAAWCR